MLRRVRDEVPLAGSMSADAECCEGRRCTTMDRIRGRRRSVRRLSSVIRLEGAPQAHVKSRSVRGSAVRSGAFSQPEEHGE